MTLSVPFIKRFRTDSQSYIYDVNTNEILAVDDLIYEIMDDYGMLGAGEITQKYAKKYPLNSLTQALGAIDQARAQGGLLCVTTRGDSTS